MPRGTPINLSQVKQIIVAELIDSTSCEISQQLNLNQQTVDRVKKREDYYKIRKTPRRVSYELINIRNYENFVNRFHL